MTLVVVCWFAAMSALAYAGWAGVRWPLPFALFMVVLGGVAHLVASRRR